MKSRKVKTFAKSKAFMSKKKLKGSIPLDASDSGSDVDSDSFFHDDVDDFHKGVEDQLSTDDELIQHGNLSSEEEEVLPITDDEKEDSENDEAEGLPNLEAWGKRKSVYYDADFVDEDRGKTYREEDAEAAAAEADEAFVIQKNLRKKITSGEVNTIFQNMSSDEDNEDLTSVTKHEKTQHVKKTSPEMLDFINDFKCSMIEIQDKLLPLLNLANSGKLPTESCAEYIKLKYHLLLHLSMNISIYMMIKSSGKSTTYHPVLQRISMFKKFLQKLKPIDDAVQDDIKIIVEKLKHNEEVTLIASQPDDDVVEDSLEISQNVPTKTIEPTKESMQIKKSKRKIGDTETEREIVSLINDVKEEMKRRKSEKAENELQDVPNQDECMEDQAELPLEEKRTITYQIAKNKGLVPHRKKEYRNPRVKHRMKFRKAKIRRKGQVREVIKEVKRYEGEPTGISTHVVRSIKLK